jgi:hypothetical protein
MFELLQINSEGPVELSYRAGQDHCTSCRVFLHHRQAVLAGELSDRFDIGGVGTESPSEFLTLDMCRPAAAPMELSHMLPQPIEVS